MKEEFEIAEYLNSLGDNELRARFLHESGYAGHPDVEHLEVEIAFGSGAAQQLLLASRSTSSEADDSGSAVQTVLMVTDREGVDWLMESMAAPSPGGPNE